MAPVSTNALPLQGSETPMSSGARKIQKSVGEEGAELVPFSIYAQLFSDVWFF